MVKITAIRAREILDSRGNPTVECDIKTADGLFRASAPSGASTGAHEAVEKRDGGKRYHGKGVQKAVKNINTAISKAIKGKQINSQEKLDNALITLDGTTNKKKLGANAILAASMAYARANAAANEQHLHEYLGGLANNKTYTLPVPAFNIINGGKHAGNQLDIQEYQIFPVGANTYADALRMGSEIYHALKDRLANRFGKAAINVGDEGGFAPPFQCMVEPLDFISDTLIALGYWKKVKLGIDAAASEFYKGSTYLLEGREYTPEQLLDVYEDFASTYPLASIEDPFDQEDFAHFAALNRTLKKTQIVGDDLTATNPTRISQAITHNSCNCLLVKPNQIGTITETLQAAQLAREHKWNLMVSHRSGDTTDDFIADLSVGLNSKQIKAGAPCRGERLAKYNHLLRLEEQLRRTRYAGKTLKFK